MKEFNSKVCTSAEQSQRLLELGLKPETADMYLFNNMGIHTEGVVGGIENNATLAFRERKIPAWSLHRLMMLGNLVNIGFHIIENAYDACIRLIEEQIRFGMFNEEYLNQ